MGLERQGFLLQLTDSCCPRTILTHPGDPYIYELEWLELKLSQCSSSREKALDSGWSGAWYVLLEFDLTFNPYDPGWAWGLERWLFLTTTR